MKNNITELVFIIDKSGSMSGYENDTVGGFNSTIKKQRETDGRVYVSTILFNNRSEVIYDRLPIEEIPQMTIRDYNPCGMTALLDAVGDAVRHIKMIHKYARPEDVPEHTIFVITTDGMENASRTYTSTQVKEMIKTQTEREGWEFIFLAANIDAVETADRIGIRRERAANYKQSSEGYADCYRAMCDFISQSRSGDINDEDWKNILTKGETK